MLETLSSDHIATTYGLMRDSISNNSHVTEALSPDCMHDILEGTLQYEVKELLKSLVAQGILTLEDLNQRIELFPYDSCDAANKPSPITNLSSSDHSLRQSGRSCLLHSTPIIFCLHYNM